MCLLRDPRLAGSNPNEVEGLSSGSESLGHKSSGRSSKSWISWLVKGILSLTKQFVFFFFFTSWISQDYLFCFPLFYSTYYLGAQNPFCLVVYTCISSVVFFRFA